MNIDAELKLSYYKTVANLCPEHGVFLVQHVSSNQFYVKKEVALFNKEIYTFLLNHPIPNTPKIIELVESDDILYIIEEYIHGTNLQILVDQNGTLPEPKVAEILDKLCKILNPLHQMNPPMVHRDIKPSNVILADNGEVYLIDFNAAKYSSTDSTSDTILLGTEGYAAPEQYGFGSSTPQTDIYALGKLANYLLYGTLEKQSTPNSMLGTIIQKSTELNPKDRYQSVQEIKDALQGKTSNTNALPVGFRSKTPWKMLVAIIYYATFLWVSISLKVENSIPKTLIVYRVITFIMVMVSPQLALNYRGCYKYMPFHKNKNQAIRILGILLGIAIFIFALLSVGVLIINIMHLL